MKRKLENPFLISGYVSLKKLLDSGFVDRTEKGYVAEDRFFGIWLASMQG